MGAIVAVIGLELVPVAADMAGWISADGSPVNLDIIIVSSLTLGLTIIYWVTLRGFLKIIPILLGIITGYVIEYFFGLVSFDSVSSSSWITAPEFYSMKNHCLSFFIFLSTLLFFFPKYYY